MRQLVAVLVVGAVGLLALAAIPAGGASTPAGRTACGDLGGAAAFSVFLGGSYIAANTDVAGRVAAGGDVVVFNWGAGTGLRPDARRLDLIAGRSLTAANVRVPNGSVTYGTTLNGTVPTPNGTLTRAPPPFPIGDVTTQLAVAAEHLAALPPDGTTASPSAGLLQLTGTAPRRNIFTLSVVTLQAAQRVQIRVPFGSTTMVNVTGSPYSSSTAQGPLASIEFWDGTAYRQPGDAPGADLEALRRATLWNFSQATGLRIGPGVAWQGSVLAPAAGAIVPVNTKIYGQIVASSLTTSGTLAGPGFDGCLPGPEVRPPDETLALKSVCVDPLTARAIVRLRNTGPDRTVAWDDRDSAQAGHFSVSANRDYFFAVENGASEHVVDVTSGDARASVTTTTRNCVGTIHLRKLATGPAAPAGTRWTVTVKGENGFTHYERLASGQSADVVVPGQIAEGETLIGVVPGGYRYTVVERDPLGAATTSIDNVPITIQDGGAHPVVVVNDYPAGEPIPPPTGGGVGGGVGLPIQPVLPPGTPLGRPGPGIFVAPGGADLAIGESFVPKRVETNGMVAVVVRVRNLGPDAATGVVARELPQLDPLNPNRDARIVSVRESARASGRSREDCTRRRPVRCTLGTLAPSTEVVIRASVRVAAMSPVRSAVMVSSLTPDHNVTNNFAGADLLVTLPPPRVAVAVRAPRVAQAGDEIAYRVSATGSGRRGARFVRFCHRPPAGLLVTSSPGAFRNGTLLCRDAPRLPRGQTSSFVVKAIPAARTAGRTLLLGASARAPGLRPVPRAVARMRVLGERFSGRG